MAKQPNPRFTQRLVQYLKYWLEKTAVLDDATITALNQEFPNLVRTLETAVLLTETRLIAAELLLQCFFWIENAGHVSQWLPLVELFVENTPNDEPTLRFRLQKQLGQLYRLEADHQAAMSQFEAALALAKQQKDRTGQAEILLNLGQTAAAQKAYDDATAYATDALAQLDDSAPHLQSVIYQLLGKIAYDRGLYETAVSHYQTALTFKHPGQTSANITRSMHQLALAYQQLKRYKETFDLFKEIDNMLVDTPYLKDRLDLKIGWGTIHYDRGEFQKAQKQFQDGLDLLVGQEGYQFRKGLLYNNLGCAYRNQAMWEEAHLYFEYSVQVFEEVGDSFQVANCFSGLARLHELKGEQIEAIQALETAITHLKKLPPNQFVEEANKRFRSRIEKLT